MTATQETAVDPVAQVFNLLGTPVLSEGRWNRPLGNTDGLQVKVKVYAEGGENAAHTHLDHEHLFFVLAGQATFFLGRQGEETKVVNQYDGVLLPRGAYYHFQSSGDENLILLRVGNKNATNVDKSGRIGPTGNLLDSRSRENGHIEGVPVPGKFFPDN